MHNQYNSTGPLLTLHRECSLGCHWLHQTMDSNRSRRKKVWIQTRPAEGRVPLGYYCPRRIAWFATISNSEKKTRITRFLSSNVSFVFSFLLIHSLLTSFVHSLIIQFSLFFFSFPSNLVKYQFPINIPLLWPKKQAVTIKLVMVPLDIIGNSLLFTDNTDPSDVDLIYTNHKTENIIY